MCWMALLTLLVWWRRSPDIRLLLEILALRQQLAIYRRSGMRPRLRVRDRVFWVGLKRFWSGWRTALVIVQPDTVARWHRAGFRLFWRWKSRSRKNGRPRVAHEIRELIRRLSRENPRWGALRIQAELKLLGYNVAESTVSKYRVRGSNPSSPTWKTFLQNHLGELVAIDFLTVPTATFRVLYVFVVLEVKRRRVVHFNVTANPSAEWSAQQIVEAFPYDSAPRYLQRDRDGIYGDVFQRRIENLGIEQVVSAPRSPWQNPYVERLIGSIRRECLDHVIVLGEALETHSVRLLRLLQQFKNPSFPRPQRPQLSRGRTARARSGALHSPSRRPPSPLHPRRLTPPRALALHELQPRPSRRREGRAPRRKNRTSGPVFNPMSAIFLEPRRNQTREINPTRHHHSPPTRFLGGTGTRDTTGWRFISRSAGDS